MRDPALKRAIDAAGGVTALASAIGITREAVSQWRRVPAERVLLVERLTNVSRNHLRPDLYPAEKQSVAAQRQPQAA